MSKQKDFLSRYGGNLAESMGAGRTGNQPLPGAAPSSVANSARNEGVSRLRTAVEIAIERVSADPNQPRTEFDQEALARLADSFESHGQLQPIAIRWSEEQGGYIIVAGERRWRAAVIAGRRTVSAVVLEGTPTESQVLEMQLIENAVREDLKPIEQARAFKALMERNGWTGAKLAENLHINAATVSRALALLDLPEDVQESVTAGAMAPSVAYEFSKIDEPMLQRIVAERVLFEKLNRAQAAAAAREAARKNGRKGRGVR